MMRQKKGLVALQTNKEKLKNKTETQIIRTQDHGSRRLEGNGPEDYAFVV